MAQLYQTMSNLKPGAVGQLHSILDRFVKDVNYVQTDVVRDILDLITPPQDGAEMVEARTAHDVLLDHWDGVIPFNEQITIEYGAAIEAIYEHTRNHTASLRHQFETEIEKLRLQLTACGVAAMSNTEQSIKDQRIDGDSPYWSASYSDVCDAVDREMALRAENERLRGAIEWALGYTDFPARKEGDPPYYWRKKLRELSGIENTPDILNRLNPTQ